MAFDSLTAVSYTHLDVYKRQHLRVPEDNLTSGGVFCISLIVYILNH